MFIHEYPYTNFQEMNLDWILGRIKELTKKVDGMEIEFLAKAKEYTDEKINEQLAIIEQYKNEIIAVANEIELKESEFESVVNAQLNIFNSKIEQFELRLVAGLNSANQYTDLAIEQNNDRIFSDLEKELAKVKVINYFTGSRISVQEMFDYLASFHLTNAATYNQMYSADKTYNELIAIDEDYTEWAVNGLTLIS